MANTDTPFGLKRVGHVLGAGYNAQMIRCYIPSSDGTALFKNDAVKLTGDADSDGVPGVIQVAAGDTIFGVIETFDVDPADLSVNHRKASTERYCYVCNDPWAIYEAQEDADGGALAATDVGANCDLVVGSGDTTSGVSAMEIDSSSAGTGTAQVRLHGFVQREDNAIGAQAKLQVTINEHRLTTTTGV